VVPIELLDRNDIVARVDARYSDGGKSMEWIVAALFRLVRECQYVVVLSGTQLN
jgi:hypothetical protein